MSEEQKTVATVNIKSLKKELDEFKTDVGGKFDNIKTLLEGIANKDNVRATTPITPENSSISREVQKVVERELPLTPEQQAVFEKYFDIQDGFTALYNIDRGGLKIIVPLTLSDMPEASKQFYKQDVRFKILDRNNILGSMESYCKLVCQQLKYNRQIRIKI